MTNIEELSAREANLSYYERDAAGRDDYWRYMAAPRHRTRVILRELSRDIPKRLLDVGCGGGNLLLAIHRRFPTIRLAGLDLSSRQINANKALLPQHEWYVGDAVSRATLDDALGQFDAIVASEVIEHVDEPLTFLGTLRSLAVSNARLILSTQSGEVHETERRVGHQRHFSAAELREMLIEAKWSSDRVWNTGFPFHDLSKWYANKNADRSMRQFSNTRYGLRQRVVCAALRASFLLNSSNHGAQLFAVARASG